MGTSKNYIGLNDVKHSKTKKSLNDYLKDTNDRGTKITNFCKNFAISSKDEGQVIANLSSKIGSVFGIISSLSLGNNKVIVNDKEYDISEFNNAKDFFEYIESNNNTYTIDDKIIYNSLYETIEELGIEEFETLKNLDLNKFIILFIANSVKNLFLQRYYGHILDKVKSETETIRVCEEISEYIYNEITINLTLEKSFEISQPDELEKYANSQILAALKILEGEI